MLRRLLPSGPGELADLLDSLPPPPPRERPHLALNMVGSLDGLASRDGRSAGLSSPEDRLLFHGLRARYGAVMAGAGTIRAERYGPIIKGGGPQPPAVIPTTSLDLDPRLPLLSDPGSHVIVLTPSSGELAPCAARVSYLRGPSLEDNLRALLLEHGIESVLCEGGPTLNAALLGARLVDELHMSISPVLLGHSEPLHLVAGMIAPTELELLWLLEAAGHLFARYAVVSRVSSATTSSSSLAS